MKRPRLTPVRRWNPITVAVVGAGVIVGLIAVSANADRLPIIGGGTGYTAYFSEAAGIKSGNEVRVAGVKVGKVTGVRLDGAKVEVTFRVKDAWVGDKSTAAIMIRTLLGGKYLAVDPLGADRQDPRRPIPLDRTVAPYDVTNAFDDLGRTLERLDSTKIAESMRVISETFSRTPPSVRAALTGLSSLSRTISSRDTQLLRLLAGTKQLSGTLAGQNAQFEMLFKDGNLLLGELRRRRQAIHTLLTGTNRLAIQLSGLVNDNNAQLRPALAALSSVAGVLERNKNNLDRALAVAGTYTRLVGNATGNGRWVDGYLCGAVPKEYLPDGTPPSTGCLPTRDGGK